MTAMTRPRFFLGCAGGGVWVVRRVLWVRVHKILVCHLVPRLFYRPVVICIGRWVRIMTLTLLDGRLRRRRGGRHRLSPWLSRGQFHPAAAVGAKPRLIRQLVSAIWTKHACSSPSHNLLCLSHTPRRFPCTTNAERFMVYGIAAGSAPGAGGGRAHGIIAVIRLLYHGLLGSAMPESKSRPGRNSPPRSAFEVRLLRFMLSHPAYRPKEAAPEAFRQFAIAPAVTCSVP